MSLLVIGIFFKIKSEDKTIKIWDMEKKTLIDTIKKENERFWILSAHPNINILGIFYLIKVREVMLEVYFSILQEKEFILLYKEIIFTLFIKII